MAKKIIVYTAIATHGQYDERDSWVIYAGTEIEKARADGKKYDSVIIEKWTNGVKNTISEEFYHGELLKKYF